MSFFTTTDTQMTLIVLASVPVLVRTIIMFFYPGTNPLQTNLWYLFLYTIVTFAAIYIYYRITA